jgi:hypothetical protein
MVVDLLKRVFSFSCPDAALVRAPGDLVGEGVPDGDAFSFDIGGVVAFGLFESAKCVQVFAEVEFRVEVGACSCEAGYASGCC